MSAGFSQKLLSEDERLARQLQMEEDSKPRASQSPSMYQESEQERRDAALARQVADMDLKPPAKPQARISRHYASKSWDSRDLTRVIDILDENVKNSPPAAATGYAVKYPVAAAGYAAATGYASAAVPPAAAMPGDQYVREASHNKAQSLNVPGSSSQRVQTYSNSTSGRSRSFDESMHAPGIPEPDPVLSRSAASESMDERLEYARRLQEQAFLNLQRTSFESAREKARTQEADRELALRMQRQEDERVANRRREDERMAAIRSYDQSTEPRNSFSAARDSTRNSSRASPRGSSLGDAISKDKAIAKFMAESGTSFSDLSTDFLNDLMGVSEDDESQAEPDSRNYVRQQERDAQSLSTSGAARNQGGVYASSIQNQAANEMLHSGSRSSPATPKRVYFKPPASESSRRVPPENGWAASDNARADQGSPHFSNRAQASLSTSPGASRVSSLSPVYSATVVDARVSDSPGQQGLHDETAETGDNTSKKRVGRRKTFLTFRRGGSGSSDDGELNPNVPGGIPPPPVGVPGGIPDAPPPPLRVPKGIPEAPPPRVGVPGGIPDAPPPPPQSMSSRGAAYPDYVPLPRGNVQPPHGIVPPPYGIVPPCGVLPRPPPLEISPGPPPYGISTGQRRSSCGEPVGRGAPMTGAVSVTSRRTPTYIVPSSPLNSGRGGGCEISQSGRPRAIRNLPGPAQGGTSACAVCFRTSGPFLAALDKKFHPDCFRCMGCNGLIDPYGQFKVKEDNRGGKVPYHPKCYADAFAISCSVCQKRIPASRDGTVAYVKHPFFEKELMCRFHAEKPGRVCTGCRRFEPFDRKFVDLSDANRCICPSCFRTVVVNNPELPPIWENVLSFFEHFLKLPVWSALKEVPVLLVSMDNGRAHFLSKHLLCSGACLTDRESHGRRFKLPSLRYESSTGSFEITEDRTYYEIPRVESSPSDVNLNCILCMSGLPRDLTAAVLAHEAAHAWIKLHPKYRNDLSSEVEEGCAQLIAMLLLSHGLGPPPRPRGDMDGPSDEQLRQYFKFCIERDNTDLYGKSYRKAAKAYRDIGIEALLNHVVQYREFPHT